MAFTNVPQRHIWDSRRVTLMRSQTAARIASLSCLVPHEATGNASSQSPLCGEETVSILTLLWLLVRLDYKEALSDAIYRHIYIYIYIYIYLSIYLCVLAFVCMCVCVCVFMCVCVCAYTRPILDWVNGYCYLLWQTSLKFDLQSELCLHRVNNATEQRHCCIAPTVLRWNFGNRKNRN